MVPPCSRLLTPLLATCVVTLSSCGVKAPLQPVNRSPVVQSLVAFPTSIAPGDSAVVICVATDPDGDSLVFDWTSDCRLIKPVLPGEFTAFNRGNTFVVYGGPCARAPLDTGWVSCEARDGRGGYAYAGIVQIVIQQ